MEIIILKDAQAGSEIGGKIVANLIAKKPNAVLGLATGSTPLKLYNEMIKWHKEKDLDFSKVRSFNLDEYVGLGKEHYASYFKFMNDNLFSQINIPLDNVNIPNGLAEDIEQHCQDYENKIIAEGGIDLQVLGIGTDGHLGFNEPTSSLASRTRIKTLDEQTRDDNKRFMKDGDPVPYHCITMGMGTVMEAKVNLLFAFGENKAQAVQQMVEGPISAMCPGSALQMHNKAIIILDELAAANLSKIDYYKWVYNNKPKWQQY